MAGCQLVLREDLRPALPCSAEAREWRPLLELLLYPRLSPEYGDELNLQQLYGVGSTVPVLHLGTQRHTSLMMHPRSYSWSKSRKPHPPAWPHCS